MKGKNERGRPALGSVIPSGGLSARRRQIGPGVDIRSRRPVRRNIRVRNNGPVFIGARAADDADVGLQPEQADFEEAIERIAAAIRQPGGEQAVQLKVAEQAVQAYGKVASDAKTTLIVPSNMTEVSGLIASAMQMVSTGKLAS